ncbi:MAG: dicarboxylate/amino acid:cation symporter [Planctomycetota bacterium]
MSVHWKIILWLVAGALGGAALQLFVEGPPSSGVRLEESEAGLVVRAAPSRAGIPSGARLTGLVFERGRDSARTVEVATKADYAAAVGSASVGDVVWHRLASGKLHPVGLELDADSPRANWIRPFALVADMFLRLLKLLIVPLILTSIITGVIGVGTGENLRRLGAKTFAYYLATSLVAIVTGLALVNLIRPGKGASLGLAADDRFSDVGETSFWEVLVRMIPDNIFSAFSANLNMLQVIFFALLFGYFVLRVQTPHRERMTEFFESAFAVMMRMAEGILSLIPYGVFCLLVKVIGQTGFDVFRPLAVYMLTVTAAIAVHCLITLPIVLQLVARVNPLRWVRAVSPALLTAFSTSSSSMTLPVTMETVEKRGGVSNRVVSFVQPLGATINMDGTALYECIGVIFLAQYYADIDPHFTLTIADQVKIVFLALLASIGAAGIPSAGLIMMVTILASLGLPIEGAALLLAVDRPLDMLRTVTNVFSDTVGSAVVARSEGETGLAEI